MDAIFLKQLLGYSALFNFIILLFWFLMLMVARDWVYSLHASVFNISKESVAKIHFAAMAGYKLLIYLIFVVPFLVLHFVL